MDNTKKNYGFVKPVIAPEDYVFGAGQVAQDVLQPDGQWEAFAPDKEAQSIRGIETFNCTAFSTLNAIEILMRRKFDVSANNSDRFAGIMAGTKPPGNSPHTVAEAIRHFGSIPEAALPFDDRVMNVDDYYQPSPMEDMYLDIGKDWLKNFVFKHEWVTPTPEKLMEALKQSPIGVSVHAWKKGPNGQFYRSEGDEDNHWALLIGYKKHGYWLIYDNYEDDGKPFKKLDWDYTFGFAKRYWLDQAVFKPSFLARLVAALKKLFKK